VLGSGDLTFTMMSGSAQTRLEIAGRPVDCGDALVLHFTHPTGSQTLFFFSVTLDIP
jgi:hypothetical protein